MEKFFNSLRKKTIIPDESISGVPFLIVGLGNPGREYRESRHNFGFMVVDRIVGQLNSEFAKVQLKSLISQVSYQGERIVFAKPQTFMNLSGQAVIPLMNYYKIPQSKLLVIHDDLDLPFSTLRMRPFGGNGGQKGLGSIIEQLGNQDFARLRCGIGHPQGQMDVKDYVLSKFSKEELEFLPSVIDRAAEAALTFVTDGLQAAMTRFNGVVEG
ncbi:MAG: aminoacyl-tRNA hydrolase [Flexilinea flocculi]|jgi:PTH1 family peptidyl-tRNA hydrolase|nr:aminoacyl-tRNA hydrolase [Flexilinea flocculi]